MPDFDRLHEYARRLADLTAPGQQEPGLNSWCIFVGEDWKEIARMWSEDPKREAAPELYAALSFADVLIETFQRKAKNMHPTLAEAFRQAHMKATAALAKANPERQTDGK